MAEERKFHLTLSLQPNGEVQWRLWRGITEPYELIREHTAFTWAAACHQAGTELMKVNQ